MTEELEPKGSDRVSIENSVHQIYKELTERSVQDPEAAPFLLMKDVFMWAVALGVSANQRLPLADSRTQIFRWDQFSQDIDVPVLKAIAVAADNDVGVLVSPPRMLRIAEEFANAGIHELRAEVIDKPGRPLWNLLALARAE